MIDKAAIANPTTHYGKGGTRQFMTQRITAVLNIVFTIFFVWFVVRLAGADRATMLEHVRNPFIAIVLCLLIINVCIHMRIGINAICANIMSPHVVDPWKNASEYRCPGEFHDAV